MGIHDELYKEGAKLGFAKGGTVKDPGVMPASKGDNQQEIEAGGRGRLKPGYKKGGKAKKHGKAYGKQPLVGKGSKKGNKKMPKNVKAKGGSC